MTFYEMICFAKVYNAVMNPQFRGSVSKEEVEITVEILKKMADNRNHWSVEQKEVYKLLADFSKKRIKEQNR